MGVSGEQPQAGEGALNSTSKYGAVGARSGSPAQKSFRAAHANTLGIIALALVIIVLGCIEITRPFGVRFSALTGGIVTMDTMVRAGILTIVVVGLNLLMGYTGQASMGQAAFYGMGAYASAILTVKAQTIGLPSGLTETWWWPWLVMIGSMFLVGGFAYLVGRPILRLRGHYLAMATLGLGVMIYIILRENFGFAAADLNITGGFDGIPDVGRLYVSSFALWPVERYFFLVWSIAIAVIVISHNIVHSRVGRALRSIRDSEVAANAMGVDTYRYKLEVFTLSTMYASLAGSLYAHFQGAVSPGPFDFAGSIELVLMSVLGGIATIWGAVLGVAVALVLKEVIRTRMHLLVPGAGGEQEVIAFGLLIVVIMIFMPDGLAVGGVNFVKRLFGGPAARDQ